MLSIDTFVVMPKSLIEEKLSYYSNKHFYEHPEICYSNIKNKDMVIGLLNKDEIEPKYMDVCILIQWDDNVILGYEMHDLNLWEDIISCLEGLLVQTESVNYLGVGTILLKMTSIEGDMLKWEISDEFPPNKIHYSYIGNRNEFIKELISGAETYYCTLIDYNFPLKEEFKEKLQNLTILKTNMLNKGLIN